VAAPANGNRQRLLADAENSRRMFASRGLFARAPGSTGGGAHYAPLLPWILNLFLLKLIASGSVIYNQCD